MDLKAFDAKMDPKGPCPKCHGVFERVKQHAHFCFKRTNDFLPYMPSVLLEDPSAASNHKFKCLLCDKSFKGPTWLANHVSSKHSAQNYLSASIKMKCRFPNCTNYFDNLGSKCYRNH